MALRKINVAIFGGGVVGGGVVQILKQRAALFAQKGVAFDLKYLVVRDAKRARDFVTPPSTVITESHNAALEDDSVDMVVEVMGGIDSAHRVRPTSSTNVTSPNTTSSTSGLLPRIRN